MKKLIPFILVLLLSCSKGNESRQQDLDWYISRVRYYKDNRTPATDTIWTLRLYNQMLVDSFSRYNGRVIDENNIQVTKDKLWHK